jgi:hypothetical protein
VDQRQTSERRAWQRRRLQQSVAFDRRTGADRRSRQSHAVAVRLGTFVDFLRERPDALFAVLALGNLLSLLDAMLTLALLPLGFVEVNPLMRELVDADPVHATIVKMAMILVASIGLWLLRRHRAAVQAAVFMVALYGAVVVYELAGLLRFG